MLGQSDQRTSVHTWLSTTIKLSTPALITATTPSLLASDPNLTVFSRMRVRSNGTIVAVGIEPLAGVLRDPRAVCGAQLGLDGLLPPSTDIQSHEFLGIDVAHLQRISATFAASSRPRRVLLFDLGCTRWDDTEMPGLRWLYSTYAAAGLQFTGIYGWEANPARSAGFFDGMPLEVLSIFHFYSRAANTMPGSPDNPLEVLRVVAEQGDYVVFKLDIDTPFVEKRIFAELLLDPRWACLIDEFYFEHHSSFGAKRPWWGTVHVDGTLHDSIALFQGLRRVGIRAHFWP